MTLTPTQKIHLITLAIYVADIPLAFGDKVSKLPLPGWLSSSWPFVIIVATIMDKALRILFAPEAQLVPPPPAALSGPGLVSTNPKP